MNAAPTFFLLAAAGLLIPGTADAGSIAFARGTVPATYSRGLPFVPNAMTLDAAGNIVTAGMLTEQAVAAKIAPDAQAILYLKTIGQARRKPLRWTEAAMRISPALPVPPNAFQQQANGVGCGGDFQIQAPCEQQYVYKVDATGTKLYFCTFVSGDSGEAGTSIAIDSSNNIYLAGTTFSTAYPITAAPISAESAPLP